MLLVTPNVPAQARRRVSDDVAWNRWLGCFCFTNTIHWFFFSSPIIKTPILTGGHVVYKDFLSIEPHHEGLPAMKVCGVVFVVVY